VGSRLGLLGVFAFAPGTRLFLSKITRTRCDQHATGTMNLGLERRLQNYGPSQITQRNSPPHESRRTSEKASYPLPSPAEEEGRRLRRFGGSWGAKRESLLRGILTPALSQREREPRRPACELFERVRRTEGLPRILPLPLGEGRGEGNWSGKIPGARLLQPSLEPGVKKATVRKHGRSFNARETARY